jgi:hypothetical protein
MHTNTTKEHETGAAQQGAWNAELEVPVAGAKRRWNDTKQVCAGCGVAKRVNAFRRLSGRREACERHPECRSCEKYGAEWNRRRLAVMPSVPEAGETATRACAGCGVAKRVNAFRRLSPEDAERSAECRSCEKHGAEKNRERLARKTAEPDKDGYKVCLYCARVQPFAAFARDERCRDGYTLFCDPCLQEARLAPDAEALPLELADELLALNSEAKDRRASLGIAIAHATCPPGRWRTVEELAAYANMSPRAMLRIERKALEKVRTQVEALLRAAGATLKEVL